MKSDRADASMIAEYAMRNYDKAVMYEPLSESLTQLRELFLYRQMVVRHRCSFQVRRGEKKLTMEKSSVKTMISQSGRHIVSELNKEIEKIDKRIAALIDSDDELSEVFNIVTSMPGIGTQNAVCLMVYTNNFRKFNYDSRKIACYYGIALSERTLEPACIRIPMCTTWRTGRLRQCLLRLHLLLSTSIKALLYITQGLLQEERRSRLR